MDARQFFAEPSQIEVKSALPEWTQLSVPSTAEARNRIVGFVRCQLSDLPAELCEQLSLAVDELLRNAIEHGCRNGSSCPIEFVYLRTSHLVQFLIRDPGPGFSLDAVAHAAINNPPEEPLRHAHYRNEKGMRPGGFGIMLVKQIADDLLYNEAGNEVTMIKYLPA